MHKQNAVSSPSVVIDCFPESAFKYRDTHTIIAIDVIRASTTIATALSLGRRVLPVRTTDEAFVVAKSLADPLLVGEIGGNVPFGFDMTNSPAEIASRPDHHRPMVFISSSGTQLMLNADNGRNVIIGCFRNISAISGYLKGVNGRVAILGAGTRGQFRREDQMCCAWIAEKLVNYGFAPEDEKTPEYIENWRGVSPQEALGGRSAEFLRKTNQERDLEFVVSHIDDLDIIPALKNGEIRKLA